MKNDYIGLLVEDTHFLLIGLLAILRSGNCVVPISPGFPAERVELIVNDCRIKVLLTDRRNYAGAQQIARCSSCLHHVICIDDIEFKERAKLARPAAGDSKEEMDKPCYVIYTSGSTGKPKGVPVTYNNLLPLLSWFNDYFKLGDHIRVLQNLSYTFDFGMFELMTTLLAGGTLYFFNKKTLQDFNEYVDFIYSHEVNCIHTTPSFFNNIVGLGRKLPSLKLIHLGGEQLSRKLVEETSKLVNEDCYIYNGYGPTETTINSSIFSLKVEAAGRIDIPDNIPIGKPSANNIIYIINARGTFQPIGITGELYIGGSGVAVGYINKPELTAARFTTAPAFSPPLQPGTSIPTFQHSIIPGSGRPHGVAPTMPEDSMPLAPCTRRLYKTGDLGRWLPDGSIEFFGRIDHQVKIRGFRIELGEIENRLLAHKDVKECVVTVREGEKANKYLCAYLVVRCALSADAIREYLSKHLPNYMTPSYFMMLDKIPLTTSGKVDLRALPGPGLETGTGYTAPRDEVEEKLAQIWADVLGIEKDTIGIDSDFFELGGHSLKAALLTARIHREFHVKIPLAEIFRMPVIRRLAEYTREAAQNRYISIESAEIRDYYALSAAQKRLFILQQTEEQCIGYNITSVWRLAGHVDKEKLHDTFLKLIRRHESLRTSFQLVAEQPVQKIHHKVKFEIEYENPGGDSSSIKNFIRPFDLSRAPLLRARLVKTGEMEYLLMLDMHHIISDGISGWVFVQDFMALYTGKQLAPLRLQFKDYIQWQVREKENKAYLQQAAYWQMQFQDELAVLELPTDFPRPGVKGFEGSRINFAISEGETAKLKALALQEGTTLYMVLLSLFDIFLAKITGQETIVVGTAAAGRRHADLHAIIGMFVNTLALNSYPTGEKRFRDFLLEGKEQTLKAFENQEYQYEYLIEHLPIRRDPSRNPLFDAMFVLQNMDTVEIVIPPLTLSPYEYAVETSKFDLTLIGVEANDRLLFTFEYSTRLFKKTTIERFSDFFLKIASDVINDRSGNITISGIEIATEKEKRQILYDFNETAAGYTEDKTIHALFEEQADKKPGSIALVYEDRQLTYGELDKRSIRLSAVLKRSRVNANDIVGIIADRGIEMVAGMIGILKANAAYLPLDPGYPKKRLSYMLCESSVKLLAVGKNSAGNIDFAGEIIDIETGLFDSDKNSTPARTDSESGSWAYVIYTSGSTGNPKGVLIGHRAIVNTLCWRKEYYKFDADVTVLQIPSFSFDSSVEDIFTPLISGSRLLLIPSPHRLDLQYLEETIKKRGVNHFLITPNLYKTFLNEIYTGLTGIKNITVAGEHIPGNLVGEHFKKLPDVGLYNEYGPTENSVCSTVYEFKADRTKILIGKPIANVNCYILNGSKQLTPVGICGELCVSGIGVADGYLNRPGLTAQKFIRDPFLKGQRMYVTGDLARWLPDGTIEFLGRIDYQVKIRGFRIELAEIEKQLSRLAEIKEAVVLLKEDENGDSYLCAYLVPLSDISLSRIKDFLHQRLPGYMVPSYFLFLEQIPLTPNGKVDRKALPSPVRDAAAHDYTAPQNRVEEKLVEIWSEILGIAQNSIGAAANFFEIGGHSLAATIMAAKIHRAFDVKLPLVKVFEKQTIRAIAEYIGSLSKNEYTAIKAAEKKEYYALSSAQQRLYVLQQMELNSIAYNIPQVVELDKQPDEKRLEHVFKKLVERHESFRTSFEMIEGEPVQEIRDEVDFKMEYEEAGEETIGKSIEDFIRPFNLRQAPLLRVKLLQLEKRNHLLMVDMHHIISDGISMEILIKEFSALYGGEELPVLKLQYKDYSEWQNDRDQQEAIKQQGTYWQQEFTGSVPLLDMPTDFPRSATLSFEGSSVGFAIDRHLMEKIRELVSRLEVTLTIFLLSIYKILLSIYTGQEELIVGIVIAGRRHADLERIIGFFVNMVPIRTSPGKNRRFSDYLLEVKEKALNAYENQDYQFEELVTGLKIERSPGRHPLIDTVFSFHEAADGPSGSQTWFHPLDHTLHHQVAHFDLLLHAVPHDDHLDMAFEYSTRLFKKSFIEKLAQHYRDLLDQAALDPGININRFKISHQRIAATVNILEEDQEGFDF